MIQCLGVSVEVASVMSNVKLHLCSLYIRTCMFVSSACNAPMMYPMGSMTVDIHQRFGDSCTYC